MSGSLYFQHTDPGIPVQSEAERGKLPVEALALHLTFPMVLALHAPRLRPRRAPRAAGHSCYRLHEARAGPEPTTRCAVSRRFSRLFWDTLRRCKLYDYERHRWLDFEGQPTSEPLCGPAIAAAQGVHEIVVAAE
jgi:omega-6 fatty acid desaturase (delta-12 desaturase)